MRTDELANLKVAIAHDWLITYGGGERVVEEFAKLFPQAPIFTTVYDKKKLGHIFPAERVIPSFMQRIPGSRTQHRKMLSLMPRAFEEFDFSAYDLVISSSSSCAKGILTPASTLHVSYIHSPMRYAWDLYPEYLSSVGMLMGWGMRRLMPRIRQWDALSGMRVDSFLANSREVASRIYKTYRREAAVLHPPIITDFFTPGSKPDNPGNYYLILSRFIPYKRIDLAIEACKRLGRRLVVVGSGPQEKELKRLSGPTVEFTGQLSDEEIRELYRNCRAFIFPGFEDFGMTPVEAQACGRPVIAYGKGGALDSVIPGDTGLFFDEQTVDSLIGGITALENMEWNPDSIRKHALGFSRDEFIRKLKGFLVESFGEKRKREQGFRVL